MKNTLAPIVAALLIQCTGKASTFPTIINTTKTAEHSRILGSRVYVRIPQGFVHFPELARYQKDDALYFQVVEASGVSFTAQKALISREAMESKGAEVTTWQEVRINDAPAVFFEGPSKKPGQTKLGLVFGTDSTYVMFIGICREDDTEGHDRILAVFRSTYYDPAYKLDPLELSRFTFDQGILSFKFAMSASSMLMYTPTGEVDTSATTTALILQSLPGMSDAKAHEYLTDLARRHRKKGLLFDEDEVIRSLDDRYRVYTMDSPVHLNDRHGIFFQSLVTDGSLSVLMMGSDFSDPDAYRLKFQRTLQSIRITGSK